MSCDERAELWLGYAIGALDGSERAELELHLAGGCPRCNGALAEARAVAAHLALSLEPEAPPAAVRERLRSRARAATRASPGRRRRGRRLAMAAILALAAGALVWTLARSLVPVTPEAEELEALLQEQDEELAALEEELEEAREALALLRSPDVVALDLEGDPKPGPTPRGRVFWDWDDYSCYFHASGLPPPSEGHAYVLWLLTDRGETLRAKSFESDARGEASFFTLLPKDMGKVKRAWVTLERMPVGDRPAGAVQLRSS